MKKTTGNITPEANFDFSHAYIQNGNTLQSLPINHSGNDGKTIRIAERKFKTEDELIRLVLINEKTLFGDETLVIDYRKKIGNEFSGVFVPDGLLVNFSNPQKPKLYLMTVILGEKNMADLFLQMTCAFAFFRNEEKITAFAQKFCGIVKKDKGLINGLKPAIGSKDVIEFFHELLRRSPAILLVMDSFKQELKGFMEAYTETWGKMIKPVFIRKYSSNGETIFTMLPSFAEITDKAGRGTGKEKSTEEDHLEDVSEAVREAYLSIKSELQKAGKEIEFRVKKFYISLRKKRNIAFFQLGKKKLSIVIANPEKNANKQLKHHEVRTLAESVKKFWNGNEHCFTVVLESKEHLEEVTSLLKKMIADAGAERKENLPANLPSPSETKAGKTWVKPKGKKDKK